MKLRHPSKTLPLLFCYTNVVEPFLTSFLSIKSFGHSVQRCCFNSIKSLQRDDNASGTSPSSYFLSLASLKKERLSEQIRAILVNAIVGNGVGLTPVQLVGQAHVPMTMATIGMSKKRPTICCAVLTVRTRSTSVIGSKKTLHERPCLLVPLSFDGSRSGATALSLLEHVIRRKILSKSTLLPLNALLVNRDNGLFDELPWARWTIDPLQRNRDAANNDIDPKYHFGKRDAYNRMMGKDWKGKSSALNNLAARLKYKLPELLKQKNDRIVYEDKDNQSAVSLALRIVQIRIREQEMLIAEIEYQLAVLRAMKNEDFCRQHEFELKQLIEDRENAQTSITELNSQRNQLILTESHGSTIAFSTSSVISTILQSIFHWLTHTSNTTKNEAPYRGATGYPPRVDTAQEVEESLLGQYMSPYDALVEILSDQLNAEVIGAVLEQSSLLEQTYTVGGAIVLRRRTPTKTVQIAGENVIIRVEEEDFGNRGIQGGELLLVECYADEAIALSLACHVPLSVESNVWERGSVMMMSNEPIKDIMTPTSSREVLRMWKTRDPLMSILTEGQATNNSETGRVSPIRIPWTTLPMFDAIVTRRDLSSSSSRILFPTDNPIQSLEAYDKLSIKDKAQILMSISNFEGSLPRPRVVRNSPEVLDQLLLPLIDESVRRQYRIRDALQRGDMIEVRALEHMKSKRHIVKEKAKLARQLGANDEADQLEKDAELYASLRADVTQDDGSYSRFLDRDEWYERQRSAQAKKLDKKKFGNLLDGIE